VTIGSLARTVAAVGRNLAGVPAAVMRQIARGSFDAVEDTPTNRRHWARADHLSADAALSPAVRRKLRSRSRYEIENNSNLEGMVDTLAMDVIGTGPSLQLTLDDDELSERIEDAFMDWAEEIDLAGKLLLSMRSWLESGEVFLRFFTNDALDTDVRLDLRVVEADQCTNPLVSWQRMGEVDGIEFDAVGNPTFYHFTKAHPGSGLPDSLVTERIDARYVIHLFRQKRPGQSRGVPELAPALPLGAYERRYTLAAIDAAETAANISLILKTQAMPEDGPDKVDARDEIETPRATTVVAPAGWEPTQLKAEQPTTTFPDFMRSIIRNMCRAFKMPFSIGAGDSSGLNYASGRLEVQAYDKSVQVWRNIVVTKVLRRIFQAWMQEAVLIEGLLPQQLRMERARMPRATWIWTGRGHVDPVKEATAQEKRLANNTTTHTDELGREGKDFRKTMKRRARDLAFMAKLGIPQPASAGSAASDDREDDGDESKTEAAFKLLEFLKGGRRRAA
jgi:lambda family phage portal protein